MVNWLEEQFLHIAGVGHNIRREQYATYITAIKAFLAEQ